MVEDGEAADWDEDEDDLLDGEDPDQKHEPNTHVGLAEALDKETPGEKDVMVADILVPEAKALLDSKLEVALADLQHDATHTGTATAAFSLHSELVFSTEEGEQTTAARHMGDGPVPLGPLLEQALQGMKAKELLVEDQGGNGSAKDVQSSPAVESPPTPSRRSKRRQDTVDEHTVERAARLTAIKNLEVEAGNKYNNSFLSFLISML